MRLDDRRATPPGRSGRRVDAVRVAAVLTGVAVAVVGGWWLGWLLALPAVVASDRLLRRIEPPATRRDRLRSEADLPLAVDLLAAAMRAGAPLDRSVLAVAEAIDGPLAERLGGPVGRCASGAVTRRRGRTSGGCRARTGSPPPLPARPAAARPWPVPWPGSPTTCGPTAASRRRPPPVARAC